MAGIEAPWVGKTPEEWHEMTTGEKEYTLTISMRGTISLFATDLEDAKEKVTDMTKTDLIDYIEEIEVENE